jgi:hypothetical protein
LASEENYPEEKTEVIYGAENIIGYVLNIISTLKSSVDNCMDANSPSMFVIPGHPITKAYQDMKTALTNKHPSFRDISGTLMTEKI